MSGLTKSVIENIYKYKEEKKITSREEIKKIKGVSDKVYEQAIGFLRIPDSSNELDNTGIHPESYTLTKELLNNTLFQHRYLKCHFAESAVPKLT